MKLFSLNNHFLANDQNMRDDIKWSGRDLTNVKHLYFIK